MLDNSPKWGWGKKRSCKQVFLLMWRRKHPMELVFLDAWSLGFLLKTGSYRENSCSDPEQCVFCTAGFVNLDCRFWPNLQFLKCVRGQPQLMGLLFLHHIIYQSFGGLDTSRVGERKNAMKEEMIKKKREKRKEHEH